MCGKGTRYTHTSPTHRMHNFPRAGGQQQGASTTAQNTQTDTQNTHTHTHVLAPIGTLNDEWSFVFCFVPFSTLMTTFSRVSVRHTHIHTHTHTHTHTNTHTHTYIHTHTLMNTQGQHTYDTVYVCIQKSVCMCACV